MLWLRVKLFWQLFRPIWKATLDLNDGDVAFLRVSRNSGIKQLPARSVIISANAVHLQRHYQ